MAEKDCRDTGSEYPVYRMTLVVDDGESDMPIPKRRGVVGWFWRSPPLRVFVTVFGWLLFLFFALCLVGLIAFGIFVFQQPV